MEWSCGAVLESRRCFGPPFWISKSCEVEMNQGGGGGGGKVRDLPSRGSGEFFQVVIFSFLYSQK